LIDNKIVNVVEVVNKDSNLNFTTEQFSQAGNEHILDILVENLGRTNFGHEIDSQRKGLNGEVLTDEKVHNKWDIFPLEFKEKFVEGLKDEKWKPFENVKLPAIYRAVLDIKDTPKDTFLKLDNWTKTVVFVNGFNVGRLWNIGPSKTLYVPAPILKTGKNEIYLFELHSAGNTVEFLDKPILG
jgi:beta-galactosidase